MEEPRMVPTVEEENEQLMRLLALLIGGWLLVFFLASLALVFYGDTLMDAFV